MPVETPSVFTQAIKEHLELKRRNAELEAKLPIDRYRLEDTFSNHPLFKSEQQARLEETMHGAEEPPGASTILTWPGEERLASPPNASEEESGLWARSRDFDWGD
jgi:hypothetical protein